MIWLKLSNLEEFTTQGPTRLGLRRFTDVFELGPRQSHSVVPVNLETVPARDCRHCIFMIRIVYIVGGKDDFIPVILSIYFFDLELCRIFFTNPNVMAIMAHLELLPTRFLHFGKLALIGLADIERANQPMA